MPTERILIHILMNSSMDAAAVRSELERTDEKLSVIVHEPETIKVHGDCTEIMVLEPEPHNLAWLEAMAEAEAAKSNIQVILYSKSFSDSDIPKQICRGFGGLSVWSVNDINQISPLASKAWEQGQDEDKTVLLVDDDNQVLKSFSRLLRKTPWNVYAVTSAERAMNILSVEKVDLVVTDIKMPGIHGLTLIRNIRKEHKDLPIIVCSGCWGFKDDLDLKFYNVSGFIEKPVDPLEFEKQITMAMQ